VISVPQLKLPVGKEERWLIFKYPVLQGRLVCTVSNSGVFLDNREASEGLSPRVVRISFTLDNLAKFLLATIFLHAGVEGCLSSCLGLSFPFCLYKK
jgi:hypothetical protein